MSILGTAQIFVEWIVFLGGNILGAFIMNQLFLLSTGIEHEYIFPDESGIVKIKVVEKSA